MDSKIPKIIHYVWVGPSPLTPLAKRCIESWQKYLPEYEIKLWNESNSPMQHHYVQEMYKQKKWAFVSDYIRFWALENEGGIYLDTDMEVLKSMNPLLDVKGFVGKSRVGDIESSIIATQPQTRFIKKALEFYDNDRVYSIKDTSPIVLRNAIKASGEDIKIYDYQYFHPINEGELLTPKFQGNAYAVHHWAESWVPFARLRKILRRTGIMKLLKILQQKL